MKFTSLMLMMALGLSAAYGLDFGEDFTSDLSNHQAEDFMEDLLDDDDFEIVDMDDALTKYRMLKEIAHVMTHGEFKDMVKHKRFIDAIWEAVKKAANKVADWFKGAWNKAKSAFQSITKKIDFKATVNKVIPYIHSGMTVTACKAAISAAAAAILGPAAALAGLVSGPLCDGALAKLEEVAG